MKQSLPLSILVVAHDEEAVLDRCLRAASMLSAPIFFVHDGECSDRSIQIARSYGANIFVRDFLGDAEPHRAWAYQMIDSDWILQVDADEIVSADLLREVPRLISNYEVACYELLWRYYDGKSVQTKHWPYKKALFQRNKIKFLGVPHEEVRPEGAVVRVDVELYHRPLYNNYSFDKLVSKHRRWAKVHARYMTMPGSDIPRFNDSSQNLLPSYAFLVKNPLLMMPLVFSYHFAGLMILGGWREGWWGIKLSFFSSVYYVLLCIELSKCRPTVSNA